MLIKAHNEGNVEQCGASKSDALNCRGTSSSADVDVTQSALGWSWHRMVCAEVFCQGSTASWPVSLLMLWY